MKSVACRLNWISVVSFAETNLAYSIPKLVRTRLECMRAYKYFQTPCLPTKCATHIIRSLVFAEPNKSCSFWSVGDPLSLRLLSPKCADLLIHFSLLVVCQKAIILLVGAGQFATNVMKNVLFIQDIQLSLRRKVFNITFRSFLPQGCETSLSA